MVIDYKRNSKILSMLYEDEMTIERIQKVTKSNGANDTKYSVIIEGVKCRISKTNLTKDIDTSTVSRNDNEIQLFTFSDADIIKGDRVTVTKRLGESERLIFLVGQVIKYRQHLIAILSIYDDKVRKNENTN